MMLKKFLLMAEVRLLRRAAADGVVIARYTAAEFGIQQSRLYRDGLLETLGSLANYPLLGSDQEPIRSGLRRHVFRSHTIYYRPSSKGVIIQRILGPGQDPLRQL